MPPLAVKTVFTDLQTLISGPAFATGEGYRLTFTMSFAEQPFASVPVTVYDVPEAGVTIIVEDVDPPGAHLYVKAPLAYSVTGMPLQTS